MRLLLLLPLLGIVGSAAMDGCFTRELFGIGYTQHDPTKRHKQISDWLTLNALHCKAQDYIAIWNNLSEWAGSADSAELRAKVVHGYKDALEREKK
jgi:hypothetical protein